MRHPDANSQHSIDAVAVPLSLYVHTPWCLRKCPYCDFWSIPAPDYIDEQAYLAAMIEDISLTEINRPFRPLISVFFGGGTPSLLSPKTINTLIDHLYKKHFLDAETEITLEANPGTLSSSACRALASAGINRLSLGVQTFSSQGLHTLGRIHNVDQTKAALNVIAKTFSNFSIDLMYGYPQQTELMLAEDLNIISHFNIPHVSLYQLTIEQNTPFGRTPPILPSEDIIENMEYRLETWANQQGYLHYETSAFALPGYECRHNLNYWHYGDYLGIGPGAHSKISDTSGVRREQRCEDIEQYQSAADRIVEKIFLTEKERLFECLMNAGRLRQGFNIHQVAQYAQLPTAYLMEALRTGESQGFWTITDGYAHPTDLGNRYLNQFLRQLVPN